MKRFTHTAALVLIAIVAFVALGAVAESEYAIGLAAAVTVVRRRTSYFTDKKDRTFTITGDNTNTLDTRMRKIEQVSIGPGTNAPTVAAESVVGGYITLTFTSAGAFTAIKIRVVGF